jgi:hypothetical protein
LIYQYVNRFSNPVKAVFHAFQESCLGVEFGVDRGSLGSLKGFLDLVSILKIQDPEIGAKVNMPI